MGSTAGSSSDRDPGLDLGGDEAGGLWLDEPPSGPPPGRSVPRRVLAVVALVAVLAVVAVPVGLALASGHQAPAVDHKALPPTTTGTTPVSLGTGPAENQVLSALSATTASGNFDVSYTLAGHAGTATTPSTQCQQVLSLPGPGGVMQQVQISGGAAVAVDNSGSGSGARPAVTTTSVDGRGATTQCFTIPGNQESSVTGSGTIDVAPKAMVVSADIGSPSGLNVSVRLDQNTVWESTNSDSGLAPSGNVATEGAGQSLSGFAGLVESTLGPRTGAIAMIGMASPAGYLDLEQESVTGAAQVGPGTVDGTPVTFYQVAVDPARLETMAGLSADEVTTLAAAVAKLHTEGYTGTTVKVGIDGAGFIRQATSTATFADRGSVVLDATFTKFGCAGTVLMPGQTASSTGSQPCASDVPTTTAAPTTTGVPPTSAGPDISTTSTSIGDVAPTSVPGGPGTTIGGSSTTQPGGGSQTTLTTVGSS